ncbi:MAG: septum formation initiator family protein [Patescibacteria group bacterium]|jgi:cell division protein FtsL
MRRQQGATPQRSWRTVVRLPAFLIINLALLFVIGISTVRESYRGWTVDHEITALEAQVDSLEGRKLQLDSLTKELASSDRIEYEARARLGRKKPGERVIVLEGYSATATWSGDAGESALDTPTTPVRPRGNPQRWWSYFFNS